MKNIKFSKALLFISLVSISFNAFSSEVNYKDLLVKENSTLSDNSGDKEYLDNNKSPFSKELYENINRQILNNDKEMNQELEEQAIGIVNKDSKSFEKKFKSVVYSLMQDFDIALSFKDLNVAKYFKQSPRNLLINFQNDRLALETKILKSDIGSKRKILFNYKKRKLIKLFFAMDDAQNGMFIMLPNLGENKIQSIIMCPRVVASIKNRSYKLVDNNWVLNSVYSRGFSDASIVINERQPAKVSAEILFSKDCNMKNITKSNEGSLVSAKVSYEQISDGDYTLLTSNISQFPLLFSFTSRVKYENENVLKEAYKRTAFEIRKFDLKDNMGVKFKNSDNVIVEKGICYEIVAGKSN